MKINLKRIGYKHWRAMLGILPPAIMLPDGFLVGEPVSHRKCQLTGKVKPTYAAFFGSGRSPREPHWEADEPLTIGEFLKAIELRRAGQPIELTRGTSTA